MKKRQSHIIIGVLGGLILLGLAIWTLTRKLDNFTPTYSGQTIDAWTQQLNSRDETISNQAYVIVSGAIVTQLIDKMFHDTNDSKFELSTAKFLNTLPFLQVRFIEANGRRAQAANSIGELGPAAQSAIPNLIQALNGPDEAVREPAVVSLGKIRSDPDFVIPLLIKLLDDKYLNDDAAAALAYFGSLAKPAIPKLLPMLHGDKDDRHAAREALKRIDPAVAKKAGIKLDHPE